MKYQLVVPTIAEDFVRNQKNYRYFFEYLPIKEIVFIAPAEVEALVRESGLSNVRFVDENDVIPYPAVMKAIENRIVAEGYEMDESSRPGWYYQQFLKMEYSRLCQEEYYLVWDSDTIPLKPLEFMNEQKKPYFDIKVEYNQGYFDTIQTLFPNMKKQLEGSFIAEHMLFKTRRMRELIADIEAADLPGNRFFEKIFFAIDLENMARGFAEFETYGTWMMTKYPQEYELRRWFSFRCGGFAFDSDNFPEEDRLWLAQDFHAVSFEKYNQLVQPLYDMFHNETYRSTVPPMQMYIMLQSSGLLGGLKDY